MTFNKTQSSENSQTIAELCRALKLPLFYEDYLLQCADPASEEKSFSLRLMAMLQSEVEGRRKKRQKRLLKESGIHDEMPSLERITFEPSRGLKHSLLMELAQFDWVNRATPLNIIITGAAGTGKTWLAKALGKKAIELNISTLYIRMPQLVELLAYSNTHNEQIQFRKRINKKKLLIIDDFAMTMMAPQIRDDFLTLIDDRQLCSSLIVISQRPFCEWYEYIGDAYHADSIMDRLSNSSYRISLKGKSLRETTELAREIRAKSQGDS